MKIKMKNEEATQNADILRTLGEEKGRLGYAIMRNLRKLDEATTEYRRIKNDAIHKYGEDKKLPDGTEYTAVKKECMAEFLDEIKDISAIEEEIDVFTVSEEEFYSGGLNAGQMNKLMWMMAPQEKKRDEK